MAEYIEREAVMLQINAADFVRDDNFEGGATLLYCDDVVDRLSAIPAADVRPVVKAHWKPRNIRNVSAVCSNCGHLRLGNGAEWATKLAYFCEKCGADMRPEPPKEGET